MLYIYYVLTCDPQVFNFTERMREKDRAKERAKEKDKDKKAQLKKKKTADMGQSGLKSGAASYPQDKVLTVWKSMRH